MGWPQLPPLLQETVRQGPGSTLRNYRRGHQGRPVGRAQAGPPETRAPRQVHGGVTPWAGPQGRALASALSTSLGNRTGHAPGPAGQGHGWSRCWTVSLPWSLGREGHRPGIRRADLSRQQAPLPGGQSGHQSPESRVTASWAEGKPRHVLGGTSLGHACGDAGGRRRGGWAGPGVCGLAGRERGCGVFSCSCSSDKQGQLTQAGHLLRTSDLRD